MIRPRYQPLNASTDIGLKYGQKTIHLPRNAFANVDILSGRWLQPLSDPAAQLHRKFIDPDFGPPLVEALEGAKEIVLLAADNTRAADQPRVLGELVRYIKKTKPATSIEIIFATGIHRGLTDTEKKQLAGDGAGLCKLSDNAGRDDSEYIEVGTTTDGVAVKLLKSAVEADAVIITGSVIPHYLAGFGGGRKTVLPGIAHLTCAIEFHSRCLSDSPGQGRRPEARSANLSANPLHQTANEAMAMLAPAFAVNVVPGLGFQPAAYFCGEPLAAFEAAAVLSGQSFVQYIDSAYEVAIASAGGHPKDINMVQSHKAIDFAAGAVAESGTLIMLAACPDGPGNSDLIEYCALADPASIADKLRRDFKINGQTAMAIREKTQRINVIMVTELEEAAVSAMGAQKAADLADAIDRARDKFGPNARAALIPQAGSFCFIRRG